MLLPAFSSVHCYCLQRYCSFGSAEVLDTLDSFRMVKLARDTGIVGTYAKTIGDVDVVFAAVRLPTRIAS